ncbi:MAG TPA: hypothetical protein VM055_07840 [Novosphingobium sp.]|nr:hypothetical protein [Novosphingobium sp.]
MNRTLIIAAALAAFAAPLPAAAAEAAPNEPTISQFTRGGVTYSYVAERRGDRRVLVGSADGRRFHLVVRKHKVSGVYDGKLVYFSLRDTPPAIGRDRFAAR